MTTETTNYGVDYFKSLVARDVRGDLSDQEYMILESNLRDWLDELNILLRDVEIQLRDHKATRSQKHAECLRDGLQIEWLFFKAEQDRWLVKALRFKVSVESRLRQVKTIRAQLGGVPVSVPDTVNA